jgi:hypothetical protein
MHGRAGRDRGRARRRRRRLMLGSIKTIFWAVVLVGVFILGLGYGRTLSGDDRASTRRVTIKDDLGSVEATLPTKTITVTKTVKVPARKVSKATAAKAR